MARFKLQFGLYVILCGLFVNSLSAEENILSISDNVLPVSVEDPTLEASPDLTTECASCDSAGGDCCICCEPPRWRATVEYLLMWSDDRTLPPLVTTSPINTPRAQAGVLGQPDTTILFGGNGVSGGADSGLRGELLYVLDDCSATAVGVSAYVIQEDVVRYTQQSSGDPIIAVPFFNAQTQLEASILPAFPNFSSGSVDIHSTQEVYGGALFLSRLLCCCDNYQVHLRAGYNHQSIDQALNLRFNLLSGPDNNNLPRNTLIEAQDLFDTENRFHGGSLGFFAETQHGAWALQMQSSIALGNMNQVVNIRGGQTITPVIGQPATLPGGLFAGPTNIGRYERDRFAVVPETHLKLRYCISQRLQATMGYSLIYWSEVAQAGEQVDRTVNLSQLGTNPQGPERPAFNFRSSDSFVHGLQFGLMGTF